MSTFRNNANSIFSKCGLHTNYICKPSCWEFIKQKYSIDEIEPSNFTNQVWKNKTFFSFRKWNDIIRVTDCISANLVVVKPWINDAESEIPFLSKRELHLKRYVTLIDETSKLKDNHHIQLHTLIQWCQIDMKGVINFLYLSYL